MADEVRAPGQRAIYGKSADVYSFGQSAIHLISKAFPPKKENLPSGTWPGSLKELILSCVDDHPNGRPNFKTVREFLENLDVREVQRAQMDLDREIKFDNGICKLAIHLPGHCNYRWFRENREMSSGAGEFAEYIVDADDFERTIALDYNHDGSDNRVEFPIMNRIEEFEQFANNQWRNGKAVFITESLGEQLVITRSHVVLRRFWL